MKIQNRLKAFFMAAQIEHHWRSVLRDRKCGDRLLTKGERINGEKMLRLNRRMTRHGLLARQHEKAYEALFLASVQGEV